MLYRTLKRMIERGNTEGMAEKLDIFFAADKLTEDEYKALMGMLAVPEPVGEAADQPLSGNDGANEKASEPTVLSDL